MISSNWLRLCRLGNTYAAVPPVLGVLEPSLGTASIVTLPLPSSLIVMSTSPLPPPSGMSILAIASLTNCSVAYPASSAVFALGLNHH